MYFENFKCNTNNIEFSNIQTLIHDLELNIKFSLNNAVNAIENDHVDCLKFIHKQLKREKGKSKVADVELNICMESALVATNKHFECLKYCFFKKLPYDCQGFDNELLDRTNTFKVVKWIFDHQELYDSWKWQSLFEVSLTDMLCFGRYHHRLQKNGINYDDESPNS
jgi:hypothetical protein